MRINSKNWIPALVAVFLYVLIIVPIYGQPSNSIASRGSKKNRAVADTLSIVSRPFPSAAHRGEYDGLNRDTRGIIRLVQAAEWIQNQTSYGEVTTIEGNAKIIQDSLSIWCDKANYKMDRKLLELFGDVIMIDPQRRLEADQVFYYGDTRRSVARGNVVVHRDSVILSCKQGQYDEEGKLATFERELQIDDLKRDIVLTGNVGNYNSETQSGKVPREPVLIRYDSTGAVDARIDSDYMEYDALVGRAFAQDNVTILWEEVVGKCQELFFYPDSGMAMMVGEPNIVRNREEATGDTIWLYLTENVLDSAVVFGQATAFAASDSLEGSPRSTMKGSIIILDFNDGEVVRMQSDGQAEGIYHIFEEGEDKGSNLVSGDRVTLFMDDGALQDVVVVGGTEGTFYPPRLAKGLRNE